MSSIDFLLTWMLPNKELISGEGELKRFTSSKADACSPPLGLIISILWTIFSTGPRVFFFRLLPLGPRRATMRLFPSHLRSAHFFMI